jgi:hypothetical protein
MKQVHHLAIIAQPALVDGKTVTCPHCNQPALVREDGSVLCLEGNKSFAPESTDGELFAMRQAFDRQNGIAAHQRYHMVPRLLAASGFDKDPNVPFHPDMSGLLKRLAVGDMLTGGHNRVYA